jgi:hypothetical protein
MSPVRGDLDKRLEEMLDRADVTDTLYRYCSTIDRRDMAGVRDTLADDVRAKYGNADWIEGGDVLVGWIDQATQATLWQHHMLSVYHVDVDGDVATALTYHTSHQMYADAPDVAAVIIARYHDRLVRTAWGWRISEKVMEIVWAGERTDPNDRLGLIGGRGPDLG